MYARNRDLFSMRENWYKRTFFFVSKKFNTHKNLYHQVTSSSMVSSWIYYKTMGRFTAICDSNILCSFCIYVPPEHFSQSSKELYPGLDKLRAQCKWGAPGRTKPLRRAQFFGPTKFCLLKNKKPLDLQI